MRALSLLPLLVIGCGLAGPEFGPDVDGLSHRGVSVEVDAREVTEGETVEAAVVNGSGRVYGTVACYLVERWDDDGWVRLPEDNPPCPLPLYILEAGAALAKPVPTGLSPGTIRLVELRDEEGRVLVASPSIRIVR